MKFLIVGLGSMGKRRIRNLKELNEKNIIGFDVNSKRCKEASEKYKIQTFSTIDDGLNDNPDVMIISTPPDLHMEYAKIALKNGIHFFTEAGISRDEMDEIIKELHQKPIIGVPSCTMRYHPIVEEINNILKDKKIGKILAFFYHSGQYLPDWHPWEDYRNFYVSKKETGGCREIVPFELVWITSIFGEISSVISDKSKISSLDADIDDIYNSLLELKNGIKGVLTVDVVTRTPIRQLKILTENATIFADWYKKSIEVYVAGDGWNTIKVDDGITEQDYLHGEKMYVKEMDMLIKAVKKQDPQTYTFEDDSKILKILEAIERSSEIGKRQVIS